MISDAQINLHGRSVNKLAKCFILSAGVILLLTGGAKILSALGKAPVLAKADPIFGIQFNYLLLAAGLIEVVIAFVCFARTNQNLALGLVAAISINFLGYRAALWLTDVPGYCPCLGTLTQTIHLSPRRADLLTQVFLAYMVLGSFTFLARWQYFLTLLTMVVRRNPELGEKNKL